MGELSPDLLALRQRAQALISAASKRDDYLGVLLSEESDPHQMARALAGFIDGHITRFEPVGHEAESMLETIVVTAAEGIVELSEVAVIDRDAFLLGHLTAGSTSGDGHHSAAQTLIGLAVLDASWAATDVQRSFTSIACKTYAYGFGGLASAILDVWFNASLDVVDVRPDVVLRGLLRACCSTVNLLASFNECDEETFLTRYWLSFALRERD